MTLTEHELIRCETPGCNGIVTVVPTLLDVSITRRLEYKTDRCRPGHQTVWCIVCDAKWEVGPFDTAERAA